MSSHKSVIMLDGGMGQELVRRSNAAPTPLWSARVMLDNPQLVQALHLDFIAAGAKVISLNNYTATPDRLRRDASADLFEPIHAQAKAIAKAARDQSGQTDVKIAGCLPPLMASYKPDLAPSLEDCLERYRTLVDVQKDGVDLFLCETLATVREAKAASQAAVETGLPVWVSFTLDDDNPACLRSGELLTDAVKAVSIPGVTAALVNCSMPETIDAAMASLVDSFDVVGAYGNGFQSVAPLSAGGTVEGLKARDDLNPDRYAQYALRWVQAGAKIIGGCCEVGPSHIRTLDASLREHGFTPSAL